MKQANFKKLAIAFPGQGAQCQGMGMDVISKHPDMRAIVNLAEKETGLPLTEVINDGDERLGQTIYTQPALLLASILLYEDFKAAFDIEPAALCGFSLGEYTALYAGGAIDLTGVFRLVGIRAKEMHIASLAHHGTMAAILGLDSHQVADICTNVSEPDSIVVPANYNSPGQTVVSGHGLAVERAIVALRAAGAKRAIALNVSGAFHSPLMHEARLAFEQAIPHDKLKQPTVPIYMNTTAKPLLFSELPQRMAAQIEAPVLFMQTIEELHRAGIRHVLEIGPGTVLAGLIRKTAPEIDVFSYQKTSDHDSLKGWLTNHELI